MKPHTIAITLILCASFNEVGCVSGPRLNVLADPDRRYEIRGASVLPPKGENWFIRAHEKNTIVFVKDASKRGVETAGVRSVVAEILAREVELPSKDHEEILRSLSSAMETEMKTDRFRSLKYKASPNRSRGSDCLKYEASVEDRGDPQFPSSVFIMDVHGFVCVHPDSPGWVVNIFYSQRTVKSKQPIHVAAEAESFLDSLTFTELDDAAGDKP